MRDFDPAPSGEISWEEFQFILKPELASVRYPVHICWVPVGAFLTRIRSLVAQSGLDAEHGLKLTHGACQHLIQRFCAYSAKIFVYELNVFSKENTFADEGEAYREFLTACSSRDFVARRWEKYGTLDRRLRKLGNNFCEFLGEHIEHWKADKADLQNLAGAPLTADQLESISFGVGDPHNGARTGALYKFASESLYYKARNLDTDVFYNEALSLLAPDCGRVATLSRSAWGWQLKAGGSAPDTPSAAGKFYHQVGAHLAVLHMLGASDIHFENVLSAGDGTVFVVDTEALFTNCEIAARASASPAPFQSKSSAEIAMERWFRRSIFRTGLFSNSRSKRGDFAGLNDANSVAPPVKIFSTVEQGSGGMALRQTDVKLEIQSCLPRIDGKLMGPREYVQEICAGYASVAECAADALDKVAELIHSRGPAKTRQVLRHTFIYQLFLMESTHPIPASDEAKLAALLAKMDRAHVFSPHLQYIKNAELSQMAGMDIPVFHSTPRSTVLDGIALDPFYSMSSAEEAAAIRHDVCCDRGARVHKLIRDLYPVAGASISVPSTANEAVDYIFEDLKRHAIFGDDGSTVAWVGRVPPDETERDQIIAPLANDRYGGCAGILAFLAKYHSMRPTTESSKLCDAAIETLLHTLETNGSQLRPGLYDGLAGILLSLSDAAALLSRPQLQERVCFWARNNVQLLECKEDTDIISGSAGTILLFLALYQRSGDKIFLQCASAAAERIISSSIQDGRRRHWKLPALDKVVLGFAHGAAGISYALYCLAGVTGQDHLLQVALEGLDGEDSYFSAEQTNWPDLRGQEVGYSAGWCSGAAGFLIARLSMFAYLDENQKERVVRVAEALARNRAVSDGSLCHGASGILECLLLAERTLPDFPRVASAFLDTQLLSGRYLSGYPSDPQNCGLMVGTAGLGLTLLRSISGEHDAAPLLCVDWKRNPMQELI